MLNGPWLKPINFIQKICKRYDYKLVTVNLDRSTTERGTDRETEDSEVEIVIQIYTLGSFP